VKTLKQLREALDRRLTSSVALVEEALDLIDSPSGQGSTTFLQVSRTALEQARISDRLRELGITAGPLAGIPVSVKDLFDIEGEVTRAGSKVLSLESPASRDSEVVRRLRASGAIIVGRTNMTEFAYDGVGVNPHFGTPKNPYDRQIGRIPGGSSSGAAISVSDGMSALGIGTDTGGSIRIPAALCGLTGFKPTQGRVPRTGLLPLSKSLDSIGAIGTTVECCATADAILSNESGALGLMPIEGLRFGILSTTVLEGMDSEVAQAFERSLSLLSKASCRLVQVEFSELKLLPCMMHKGSIVAAEAYKWHGDLAKKKANLYDPRILGRVMRGGSMSAADYLDWCEFRQMLIERANAVWAQFDAVIMPTVPIIAPPINDIVCSDSFWEKTNASLLRNPSLVNLLDGCAITLPCSQKGDAPVGLMIVGVNGADRHILQIGMAVERLLESAQS